MAVLQGPEAKTVFLDILKDSEGSMVRTKGPSAIGFYQDSATGVWIAFDNSGPGIVIVEFEEKGGAQNWVRNRFIPEEWRLPGEIFGEEPMLMDNPPVYQVTIWDADVNNREPYIQEMELSDHARDKYIEFLERKRDDDQEIANFELKKKFSLAPSLVPNPSQVDPYGELPEISFDDVLRAPVDKYQTIAIQRMVEILGEALGEHILTPRAKNVVNSYKEAQARNELSTRAFAIAVLKFWRRIWDERQNLASKNNQRTFDDYNPGGNMEENPPKQSVFDIPVESSKWAKIISLKSPADARSATAKLSKSWKGGDRKMKRKLRRMAILAGVRARIMAQNDNLKSATRKQKKVIQSIYERWVKAHGLPRPNPRPNPPEDAEYFGLGLAKNGIVSKIYKKDGKFYRGNPPEMSE